MSTRLNFDFTYAGMTLGDLAVWVVLCAVAGAVARAALKGPRPLGLFGDMVIAMAGAFGVGWVSRAGGLDLSQIVVRAQPSLPSHFAIWIDIFAAALLGALAIRMVLRLAGGGGR